MRKPDKPNLLKGFTADLTATKLPGSVTYVVDGGCLLHKVRWKTGEKFGSIMQRYVSYVNGRFGKSAWVVFDGYDCKPDTKDHERKRLCAKATKLAPDVEIGADTTL